MKDGYVKNNKVLGVLGGMGPAASAEFLRILTELSPAEIDQEHPVIYAISGTDIPDRSSAIMKHGENPTTKLLQYLEKLVSNGADVLAVPCNTAHYFLENLPSHIEDKFINIVEATLKKAQDLGAEGAWILSTEGTRKTGLYQKYALKKGYLLYAPTEEQSRRIQKSIELVKYNELQGAGELVARVVNELWQKKPLPIMMACTEIPLAYAAAGLPKDKAISSLQALALECLARLYMKK